MFFTKIFSIKKTHAITRGQNQRVFSLFFAMALGPCLGCQTNELKAYEKLTTGMDKGEVLDIMGSPQRSDRWRGEDRWTYQFYQNKDLHTKEVHFLEGRANYVGNPPVPEVSAEEQDQRNAAENKKIEESIAQQKIEQRAKANEFFNNEPSKDQIRYVPQFVPMH